MPNYYPIFLNLHSSICLVVGAGPVGARKSAALLDAGATVRLVAVQIGDAAAALLKAKQIELMQEPYVPDHLNSVSLAFAATDNSFLNAQIASDARIRNIPVNRADSPDYRDGSGALDAVREGEFIVPSTLRRGDLCIAISTAGASPKLAQRIRAELEALYIVEYAGYVELLGDMRGYIKEHAADSTQKSAAFESLLETETRAALLRLLRDAGGADARDEARRIIEAALRRPPE